MEIPKPCNQKLDVSLYEQNYVFPDVIYCVLNVTHIFKTGE